MPSIKECAYFTVYLIRFVYPSSVDIPSGGLSRLFDLPPALLVSINRFGIERTARGSYYPAEYAEAVFSWREYFV